VNPKLKLINPANYELDREAKKVIDNVMKQIRAKNNELKQAISTSDVTQWFENVKDKKFLKFINWDIDNLYTCITPTILGQSLDWASQYVDITAQQRKIIMQSCESFLFFTNQAWVKKGDINFDVGMGAYHGVQICELIGFFMMSAGPNQRPIPDHLQG
jgi:hypothetical protein